MFLLTYRYKWVPWLSSCTSICFIYYHKTSIFAVYIIFCWCFGIHHVKEKLWTLIKLISTCANYIVDVIKYLTYDCIALRRSSHRSPTKSIFRIKHVKSRSEQRIARHQLVYCPNLAYSDAKYHVIKTPRPKYLYKSLESSRSSDILFYNEHSSIYMPMHPTVRPIYWVIYMYIFWTTYCIMREREREMAVHARI